MCGIFGIFKHKGSPKFDYIPLVKAFFKNSISRGRDATGYAYIEKDTLYFQKQGVDADKFIAEGLVDGLNNNFSTLIGHVRHGTRGSPQDNRNNHPLIADDVMVFALVHNGVISGQYHGQRELHAEVDTAIMRANVSDNLEAGKSLPDAIKKAVEDLAGSMTTAIIAPKFKGIILTKVRNPLWLAYIPQLKITVFASTDDILRETMNTYFPKFNEVFPPYYMYEPPDESLVVVTEDKVEVTRLNRRDATWSSAYDWRTQGTTAKISTQTVLPVKLTAKDIEHEFDVGDFVRYSSVGVEMSRKVSYFSKGMDRGVGKVAKVGKKKGNVVYDVLFDDDTLIINVPEEWLTVAAGHYPKYPRGRSAEDYEFGDYP
jgi:glucosamine 6-phosphate synthetase-like amidotransferase/phosphosugar isomerase protein